MKKLLYLLFVLPLFCACSSDDDDGFDPSSITWGSVPTREQIAHVWNYTLIHYADGTEEVETDVSRSSWTLEGIWYGYNILNPVENSIAMAFDYDLKTGRMSLRAKNTDVFYYRISGNKLRQYSTTGGFREYTKVCEGEVPWGVWRVKSINGVAQSNRYMAMLEDLWYPDLNSSQSISMKVTQDPDYPYFTASGKKWYFDYYPNGVSESSESEIPSDDGPLYQPSGDKYTMIMYDGSTVYELVRHPEKLTEVNIIK